MKAFTKEVKIAIVAIVGVIILFFGMNFLKGLNLFSSTDDYYIEFKDISGLSSSSPIYADGYQVGTVKDVIYDYSGEHPTRVLVSLDKAMRIPVGSSAEIESDLMGNIKVNLLLANNPRERVMPGGTITGEVNRLSSTPFALASIVGTLRLSCFISVLSSADDVVRLSVIVFTLCSDCAMAGSASSMLTLVSMLSSFGNIFSMVGTIQ